MRATYSPSRRAPPIQAVQTAMSSRASGGMSLWTTMSAIWSRPPGFRARNASRNTATLSGDRLMTPLEMTRSASASSRGSASAYPSWYSTCREPVSATFSRPRSSIARVMSRAMTRPAGPTARAARRLSVPLPAPMSTTVSPGRGAPRASGLPTPAKGAVTESGSSARAAGEYPSRSAAYSGPVWKWYPFFGSPATSLYTRWMASRSSWRSIGMRPSWASPRLLGGDDNGEDERVVPLSGHDRPHEVDECGREQWVPRERGQPEGPALSYRRRVETHVGHLLLEHWL